MRNSRTRPSALITVGVVAIGVIVVLGVLVSCMIDDWEAKIAAYAAIAGGVGSGYGGVAAAIAAMRSRDAALQSDDVARRVSEIGEKSETALKRAVKPSLDVGLSTGTSFTDVAVYASDPWPARSVEVRALIKGYGEIFRGSVAEVPTRREDAVGRHWRSEPGPGDAIQLASKDWTMMGLECAVQVRFTDFEGLARYENEYRADLSLLVYSDSWKTNESSTKLVVSREIPLDWSSDFATPAGY